MGPVDKSEKLVMVEKHSTGGSNFCNFGETTSWVWSDFAL